MSRSLWNFGGGSKSEAQLHISVACSAFQGESFDDFDDFSRILLEDPAFFEAASRCCTTVRVTGYAAEARGISQRTRKEMLAKEGSLVGTYTFARQVVEHMPIEPMLSGACTHDCCFC